MMLTCEACQCEPALMLLVADMRGLGKTTRLTKMMCEQCTQHNAGWAKNRGDAFWVYRLMPEYRSPSATE
jgi:protein-arginine kinase activator protein McsA